MGDSGETLEADPHRLLGEQLEILARNWERVPLPVLVACAGIGYLVWPHVPVVLTLGWIALVALLLTARTLLARSALRTGVLRKSPEAQARRFAGFTFPLGLVEGASALLFLPLVPPPEQAFVTMILGGWSAGSVGANSAYPRVYNYFAAGFFPPVVGAWLLQQSAAGTVAAVLLAYFAVMMVAFCRQTGERIVASIAVGLRNEELVARLTASNFDAELARVKAEDASQAKSRFLAAASHDLRQPLHALSLLSGLLNDTALPADQKELVGGIKRSVASLDKLFGELLDLSKLDAGVVQVREEALDLDALLADVAAEYRAAAGAKGLSLSVRSSGAWITTDAVLFERITRNLLENAVRYTERGGISIECRREPEALALVVADTGIGIPVREQGHIFDEFYQADSARRRHGGIGLGLAIVRRTADLLGFDISVVSEEGVGSRFCVRIPQVKLMKPMLPAVRTAVTEEPARAAGKRVVVVDDDEAVLASMAAVLRRWQCAVTTALSPEELGRKFDLDPAVPDLLVVDYRLDGAVTGVDVVNDARVRFGHVPAILITADTSPRLLAEFEQSGLLTLHKPVQPAALAAAIDKALAMRESSPRERREGGIEEAPRAGMVAVRR